MKLERIDTITGKIRLITGLHIGGNKGAIEIGGLDQSIIKHPLTKEPYIPGSSIKGKMRSLLELHFFIDNSETREFLIGKKDPNPDPRKRRGLPCGCGDENCNACRIFGTASDKKNPKLGPTRIIVRDAYLTNDFREKFEVGDLPMEEKYENVIDRVRGTADHPRPLERVPAGVEFDFKISFRVFEGDNKDNKNLINYVYKGLKLIELDALGGCSSRGCGQVKFIELAENEESKGDDFLNTVKLR